MGRKWLVTGGTGFLGSHVVCELAGTEEVFVISRNARLDNVQNVKLDLTDHKALRAAFTEIKPTHLLHLAAIGDIATCNSEPGYSYDVNVSSVQLLGQLSASNSCRMLFTSTDMVFDGENAPYDEDSTPEPINSYGRQKHNAERLLSGISEEHLIIRLPLMFGIGRLERKGGSYAILQKLVAGESVDLFTDEYRTPLWVSDAAEAIISLAKQNTQGIIHLPGPERVSRYQLGVKLANAGGLNSSLIIPQGRQGSPLGKERPRDVSLQSKKAILLGFSPTPLEKAVEQVAKEFNDTHR